MKTLTPEQAMEQLKSIKRSPTGWIDYEIAHATADDILCGILLYCGHEDIVNEYLRAAAEADFIH